MRKQKQYEDMTESERLQFSRKIRRRTHGLIKTKSTKRQWFYFVMEFATILLGANLAGAFSENPVVPFVVLALTFAAAIFWCVLCVRNGRKRYVVQRAEAESRIDYGEKIIQWFNQMEDTDPLTLDAKGKSEFLLAYLYFAARIADCRAFWFGTFDFSREEILRKLSVFSFSEDLRRFLNEVLLQNRTSESVARFEPELYVLVARNLHLENRQNLYLRDEGILYTPNNRKRFRVCREEETGKFFVKTETWFTDYMLASFWVDSSELIHEAKRKEKKLEAIEHKLSEKRFLTAESAEKEMKALYHTEVARFDAEMYFAVKEENPAMIAYQALRFRFVKMGKKFDEPLTEILRYAHLVSVGGHREYARYAGGFQALSVLHRVVSTDVFLALQDIFTSPINSFAWRRAIRDADRAFFAEREAIENRIWQYCLKARAAMGYPADDAEKE